MKKTIKTKIAEPMTALFLVVLIDMIGFGIVIPLFAPMLLGQNHILPELNEQTRSMILGLMIATYPIAQFFGAPIIGGYSDRVGRKKALLITIAGTAIGYIAFAIGVMMNNIPIMLASRILEGFMGGNIAVAYSAIADISEEKNKAKNFGLIGMAFGIGLIIGPFIGGKLADNTITPIFNYSTPFIFAALLSFLNLIIIHYYFKETIKEKVNKPINALTGIINLKKAFEIKSLRTILIIAFLLSFGFSFFAQFSQVYWVKKFQMTEAQIGDIFAWTGLWIAITQGIINRKISTKFKPIKVLSFSPLMLSIALFLLLIPNEAQTIYLITPLVAIFQGLTYPNQTALISSMAGKESQGEILGITQSIASISFIIPPIISGIITTYNYSAPIIMASTITFIAWFIFITHFKKENKHLFHEV
ncbi:MAG: MFS transporter [Candidatus Diapherotrites archaeon]